MSSTFTKGEEEIYKNHMTDEMRHEYDEYQRIIQFANDKLASRHARVERQSQFLQARDLNLVNDSSSVNNDNPGIAVNHLVTTARMNETQQRSNQQEDQPILTGRISVPTLSKLPDTSVLNYSIDYYKVLGVSTDCSETELSDAIAAGEDHHAKQLQAFKILSDGPLRKIYDDSRAWAVDIMCKNMIEEGPGAMKEQIQMNYSRDYYKERGSELLPTSTAESIDNTYNHKMGSVDRNMSVSRTKDDQMHEQREIVQESYAVLTDPKHREIDDSGCNFYRSRSQNRSGGGYETIGGSDMDARPNSSSRINERRRGLTQTGKREPDLDSDTYHATRDHNSIAGGKQTGSTRTQHKKQEGLRRNRSQGKRAIVKRERQ